MSLGVGKARPRSPWAPDPSPKFQVTSEKVAWTVTVSGTELAVASGIAALPAHQNQVASPASPTPGLTLSCRFGHGCRALASSASWTGETAAACGGAGAWLGTQTTWNAALVLAGATKKPVWPAGQAARGSPGLVTITPLLPTVGGTLPGRALKGIGRTITS